MTLYEYKVDKDFNVMVRGLDVIGKPKTFKRSDSQNFGHDYRQAIKVSELDQLLTSGFSHTYYHWYSLDKDKRPQFVAAVVEHLQDCIDATQERIDRLTHEQKAIQLSSISDSK